MFCSTAIFRQTSLGPTVQTAAVGFAQNVRSEALCSIRADASLSTHQARHSGPKTRGTSERVERCAEERWDFMEPTRSPEGPVSVTSKPGIRWLANRLANRSNKVRRI